MHTKDFLAQELRKAGLELMAKAAETGYYHDFLSPLPAPSLQLEHDLRDTGTPAALALRERHLNGEFDASHEESETWINSADGQRAMKALIPTQRRLLTSEE